MNLATNDIYATWDKDGSLKEYFVNGLPESSDDPETRAYAMNVLSTGEGRTYRFVNGKAAGWAHFDALKNDVGTVDAVRGYGRVYRRAG